MAALRKANSANPPPPSNDSSAGSAVEDLFGDPIDEDELAKGEMNRVLNTPYEAVYQVGDDGKYIRPSFLRGTPVEKVSEDSPYWEHSWGSLDTYLAREVEEESLKHEYGERLRLQPNNKSFQIAHKRHKDNVSKHRKIREVFGGQESCHPNQLVAKKHLPLEGLCEQETMYMLGCKMTDLSELASRGKLAMHPWDFIRWRIGRLMMERVQIPGLSGKAKLKSVIFNISNAESDDRVFRQIIEYSAELSGHKGRYGQKKTKKSSNLPNGPYQQRPANSFAVPRVDRRRNVLQERRVAQQATREEIRQRLERDRRNRPRPQSTYQGVNAYRQQMGSAQGGQNGGPCGG